MLQTVIRVEWRNLRRETSAWITVSVFAALVVWAALNGRTHTDVMTQSVQEAHSEQQQQMQQWVSALAAGDENAQDAYKAGKDHVHQVVALPLSPLASISMGGLSDTVLRVSLASRLESTGEAHVGSPVRQATGPFDVTFVFVYLLPLVVIGLSYDLLSGERERGTLALILSQPVSLVTFTLGKAIQRALVLLGVVFTLATVAPWLAGGDLSEPGAPARLGLYLLLVAAYTTFWFAAAVAVNAWGSTSAGNALALMACWLVLIVILPGFVSVGVDVVVPQPSRIELLNLAREAAAEAEQEASQMEGDHAPDRETLKDRYRATVKRSLEVQQELESTVKPVLEQFQAQLSEQQALVDKLRFVSPAIILYEGLTDVAGVGVDRRSWYLSQVDRFHDQWRSFFSEKAANDQSVTAADIAALPRFHYAEEPTGKLTLRVMLGSLGLVFPTAVLLLLAWRGLRRPDAVSLR
ncbi:MAG: ABC transporter permease subunit [Myxococcales bacterium]|nr:ABC transporter permease subunit [Myxococcales bacterium]